MNYHLPCGHARSFWDHLGFFPKTGFPKHYFYSYDSVPSTLFIDVTCDSPHKSYFFEIMKMYIEKKNEKNI